MMNIDKAIDFILDIDAMTTKYGVIQHDPDEDVTGVILRILEKEKPIYVIEKTCVQSGMKFWLCPKCRWPYWDNTIEEPYCSGCGQKLKWGDE